MSRYARGKRLCTSFEGAPKQLRPLLAAARDAGAEITITGHGHYQIRLPGQTTVHAPSTPRIPDDAAKRLRMHLRHRGVEV